MAKVYLDTSALAKRYVQEIGTDLAICKRLGLESYNVELKADQERIQERLRRS